jgi:hypothetical protein
MRRRLALVLALALVTVGAAACDPTTGRPPSPSTPVPGFAYGIYGVTTAQLGATWRPGCPVGAADLRLLRVSYWGYDGAIHKGDLVVHRLQAVKLATVFKRLYADRFQIRRIHPASNYGGSDDRSMAANNTSAFNCRAVTGGTGWSEHSYGRAIDINPIQNPYVRGSTILPPEGRTWADRSLRVPGMIHPGDKTVQAFAAQGWSWGGSWNTLKDYQHFSSTNR